MEAQPGPFTRLFKPQLEAHDNELAQEIGKPFGPMHSNSGQGGNPRIPAGFTYLGQLIDHDLTFDPITSLKPADNAGMPRNFRTAAFDLDSLYALGPDVTPYLYDVSGRKFLLGGNRHDLPRLGDIAVTGDPRNDENIIISQLVTAFLNFHNAVADREKSLRFSEIQLLVRQHYQWIVLNQYLPAIVNSSPDRILGSTLERGYPDQPSIPLEFSLAAFRFGHSQVRKLYDINGDVQGKGRLILPDLAGHRRLTSADHVDWSFFFNLGRGNRPQPSLPIQPFISPPLLNIPSQLLGPIDSPFEVSVAYRDIRRGQLLGLPTPEDVAQALKLGSNQLVPRDVIWSQVKDRLKQSGSSYDPSGKPVPLWLYILFEAQELAGGEHLGPMASRIVSDVFVGLLKADPQSILSVKNWKPSLGADGNFGIADLLRMAQHQMTGR
jgi:hypothetical protein